MRDSVATPWSSPAVRDGVLALSGYGIRVAVRRRHLVVEDGIGRERHWSRFSRATARLKRLVILGGHGTLSLDSLRWLRDIGAGLIHIDRDGQVLAAFGPLGLDDARLRRSQAGALGNGLGMRIGRELVRRKLDGQLSVLQRLADTQNAATVIRKSQGGLERATTPAQLRLLESAAAAAYWKAWERIPVRFVRRDESKVPDHWRTFGSRGSPLAIGPRLAATPGNAILNYLYAILEGEAAIAALAMGLDPGMGVFHTDQPSRNSLALDLTEAVRPEVDAYVLELLERQVFRASDFLETRQGVCRLLAPLTKLLSRTTNRWALRVAPATEWVAQALAITPDSRIQRLATPLTQARRSAGRSKQRRRQTGKRKSPKASTIPACRVCGVVLAGPNRSYCGECRRLVRAEGLEAWKASGTATLVRLMAEGRDPSHGGIAALHRADSLARRRREAAEWERTHRVPNAAVFVDQILPGLRSVPLSRIVEATGLTIKYCSLIRRGLYVPHARHWEALKSLSAPKGEA